MDIQKQLTVIAQRIRALAQNGLIYSLSEYDTERYEELQNISTSILSLLSGIQAQEISDSFTIENEYATPKVDIRAVVFDENKQILLVKEKADRCWSIPGGWADIGFTPGEIAVKEVKEETGLDVVPVKLLAVLDKKCHNHPPALHYVYKIFILCEITGGQFHSAFDILDKGFFDRENLPELSKERITKEQIDLMFEYKNHPKKEAITD